jgi:hypothetical protein
MGIWLTRRQKLFLSCLLAHLSSLQSRSNLGQQECKNDAREGGRAREKADGGAMIREMSLPDRSTTITSENKELPNIQDQLYV